MIKIPQRLPDPKIPVLDPRTGKMDTAWYQYFREIDDRVRKIIDLLNVEFP